MTIEAATRPDIGEARADEALARPPAKEMLRLRLFAGMLLLDVIALTFGFELAGWLRYGDEFRAHATDMLPVILPIYLVLAFNNRAYSLNALIRRGFGIAGALRALAFAAVAVIFISFYLHASSDLSRLVLSGGSIIGATAMVIARIGFHRLARRAYGETPLSIVLLTDRATAIPVEGAMLVDAKRAGLRPDVRDPLMLDRLGRFLKTADRVVVACPREARAAWSLALKGANIRGEIVDPEVSALGTLGTGLFGAESTLLVSTGPLGLRARIIKRAIDLAMVVPALLFAAPIMLLTALAIRIEDGGPSFFVQERLGRGNRLFRMYKFRSMKTALCDEAGNCSTGRSDTRVTRIGRIIRRTSIDELPQLINILKGDMSFVGPRPHALGSLAGDMLFWEVDQRYWHRHASKPGLTGLAQVRGFRGATSERSDLVNRLQADLEYVSSWSIGRDLRILLATVKVLVHKNAF